MNMLQRLLAVGCAALLASGAHAHDFWIQPEQFEVQPGSGVRLTLQVGYGEDRQRSQIPAARITRFSLIGPQGGDSELLSAFTVADAISDGPLRVREHGLHLLALETDSDGRSHLPADLFNAYLQEEGLTPAMEVRRKGRREGAPGRELYGRCAKSIIQAGKGGSDLHVTRPIGLTLEIVPEVSPDRLPSATSLPVRVYYEGLALGGALVKLTDLSNDAAPIAAQRTDATGRTAFAIPKSGRWLLSVVWTKPLSSGNEADFRTTFSSLSFAIPQR